VKIFHALRSIGVAEDKAAKAAEAMATLEPRFAAMRSEFRSASAAMRLEYRGGFAAIRSDLRILTLRVNLIIAFLLTAEAAVLPSQDQSMTWHGPWAC
jgi:hypothetical protein